MSGRWSPDHPNRKPITLPPVRTTVTHCGLSRGKISARLVAQAVHHQAQHAEGALFPIAVVYEGPRCRGDPQPPTLRIETAADGTVLRRSVEEGGHPQRCRSAGCAVGDRREYVGLRKR